MEIASQYNPQETENKWYSYWLENKLFKSVPDNREPYTIVIPPPNVTGVLHMGHMLNNTIQDILVRRARMQGKNACWVPGTDHASIATEAKVVTKLKSEGIDKNNLSRDEFMKHAWEWKEKHGGIILEQLKKLGASCDWDRTRFTMDEELYSSVIKVFVDLYNKGKIYRGIRMVNWDPSAKTAVSDEEVIYKEEQSKLYYLKYKLENEDDYITIATTRPETILGDTAVCVHPEDERFTKLHGKKVIVPLVNRAVPIIQDEYVDREFGTGALKITPAHDIHDYEIGQKYNLQSIDIFNDDGTLNESAELYIGQDRFEVRKLITKQLEEEGYLAKIDDYVNKVGFSERTDAAIEPKLSMQWFLKMDELSKPALENVNNDNINFFPKKFKNVYKHWMENIKDWNISRQLWWGQRIPAFYLPNSNEFVVAENIEKALELAKEKTGNKNLQLSDLKQDEDVLDTWFSSWLWPISVFNGINEPDNEEIKYYYPTNDIVTGHDIIFFWIARMIISGYEYRKESPFKNVYFTGMVRDKQGRKMSKQLGNSPDPLKLIEKYGADGVRIGMLLCSPAGGDLLYDDKLPEQGRNFSNKIWNAFRLVNQWPVDEKIPQPEASVRAIKWFENKFSKMLEVLDNQFVEFRISEAVMTVYKFFWDEFSAWYLEMIKPAYQQPIDALTYNKTLEFFDKILRVLHPFMPFITEEIWQLISERKNGESIVTEQIPSISNYDEDLLNNCEMVKEIISSIRNIKKEKNIPQRENVSLKVNPNSENYNNYADSIVMKLAGVESIEVVDNKVDGAASFIIKGNEYYVPLGNLINKEEEIKKLQKELDYTNGFLQSVMKKLSNERFVNNAPESVVAIEKSKQAEAESKIVSLEEQIKNLK
ncbi:MAG: valine--tRNA ligase [Bacteroidales bacterium]|nr:valine--tRNA ligase [Bacteroidales bacterium]MBN2757275.1 valine--tRNA ligase [Bacteroidales bacterium]